MEGYRSSSQKNLILGIITVILAILLGNLLWMNSVSEDKKSAELWDTQQEAFEGRARKKEALKQMIASFIN